MMVKCYGETRTVRLIWSSTYCCSVCRFRRCRARCAVQVEWGRASFIGEQPSCPMSSRVCEREDPSQTEQTTKDRSRFTSAIDLDRRLLPDRAVDHRNSRFKIPGFPSPIKCGTYYWLIPDQFVWPGNPFFLIERKASKANSNDSRSG